MSSSDRADWSDSKYGRALLVRRTCNRNYVHVCPIITSLYPTTLSCEVICSPSGMSRDVDIDMLTYTETQYDQVCRYGRSSLIYPRVHSSSACSCGCQRRCYPVLISQKNPASNYLGHRVDLPTLE